MFLNLNIKTLPRLAFVGGIKTNYSLKRLYHKTFALNTGEGVSFIYKISCFLPKMPKTPAHTADKIINPAPLFFFTSLNTQQIHEFSHVYCLKL